MQTIRPASATVPTVEDVLGHIAGAADVLSYSHEVHRYMRAVANASPRVKVFSIGHSEEGREMIVGGVAEDFPSIREKSRTHRVNLALYSPHL